MALSKKAKKDIAGHINAIQCAQKMRDDFARAGDEAGVQRWTVSQARSVVWLADTYGIELPALNMYRADVREADASIIGMLAAQRAH